MTETRLYTDAEVQTACFAADHAFTDGHMAPTAAQLRAVLDAVAPAIAARALREAATRYDDFARPDSGLIPPEWVEGFMEALDGAVADLRTRADEIEAS